ncbi:MAG: sigma-70 family RNA polymerase sigma factor [Acidimicrobiia bacterium]|nr:sigma-70 family RNA polymerase sigma factor [Acidimicrobiia bacterium]
MELAGGSTPEEFYELIAQYSDDAFRLARRLSRNTAEAEDIAQTAMFNVLRRAEYIRDETKIRSYLLTSVRNAWRNQLRSKGRRKFLGSDIAELLPSDDMQPEEEVLTVLDASVASAALAALSPKSREIIELRYVEGLEFQNLADRLGISAVAARQRAHRAREELVGACMEIVACHGEGLCRTVRSRLGRYHRGLLSRSVRSEVEIHLEECEPCFSCYDQLIDLYGHRLGRTSGGGK